MIEEYKRRLHRLIQNNKIELVIKSLTEFSNDDEELRDEIIILGSRLESLDRKTRTGIIGYKDEEGDRNRIKNDLLKFINRLSLDGEIPLLRDSKAVIYLREELEKKDKRIQELQDSINAFETRILSYQARIKSLKSELVNIDNKKSGFDVRTISYHKSSTNLRLYLLYTKYEMKVWANSRAIKIDNERDIYSSSQSLATDYRMMFTLGLGTRERLYIFSLIDDDIEHNIEVSVISSNYKIYRVRIIVNKYLVLNATY